MSLLTRDLGKCAIGGKSGARVDPAGYDAGERMRASNGIGFETQSLVPPALAHPADGQDRDSGLCLSATLGETFSKLKTRFADTAWQRPGSGSENRVHPH